MTRPIARTDVPVVHHQYDGRLRGVAKMAPSSPTFSDVALNYLTTTSGTRNLVLKPLAIAFGAAALWDPSNPSFSATAKFASDAKNLTEGSSLPAAIGDLRGRCSEFRSSGTLEAFGGVAEKTAGFLVPFADFTKAVSNRVVPLSSRFVTVLGFMGAAATVLSMSNGIDVELAKISGATKKIARDGKLPREAQAQVANSHLVIARNVHYLSLGAFSVASTLTGMLAPAPLMIALAAGGLFFTLMAHFHAKMVLDPAKDAVKAQFVRV